MVKMYNASGESITLPITMSWDSLNRGRRVPIIEIGNGGGVLGGPEVHEVKNFTLKGTIYYETASEMRTFLDDVLVFLEDSPIRVYQDESDSRFIYARCTNLQDTWMDGRAELELTIDMTAMDPFFYSVEHDDVQSFTAATKQFSLFVGGNKEVHPYILLNRNSGDIGNLKITNVTTGRNLALTGATSTSIAIDNKNLMILAGSTSILSSVNTGWLLNSLNLVPGENVIKVEGTGTYDFTVVTKWRSKWL